MNYSVANPTHRSKAVRTHGGLLTVRPGVQLTVVADWDAHTLQRYREAGLVCEAQADVDLTDTSTLGDPPPPAPAPVPVAVGPAAPWSPPAQKKGKG